MAAVRPATVADARRIAEVHVRTWQAAYRHVFPADFLDSLSIDNRERGWKEELTESPGNIHVAEIDGRVVGFAAVGPARGETGLGELYAIYVEPAHWGTGVGHTLLVTAQERLAELGFDEAMLWVLADNPRARRVRAARVGRGGRARRHRRRRRGARGAVPVVRPAPRVASSE